MVLAKWAGQGLGHGLGLFLHKPPFINKNDSHVLEVGYIHPRFWRSTPRRRYFNYTNRLLTANPVYQYFYGGQRFAMRQK